MQSKFKFNENILVGVLPQVKNEIVTWKNRLMKAQACLKQMQDVINSSSILDSRSTLVVTHVNFCKRLLQSAKYTSTHLHFINWTNL